MEDMLTKEEFIVAANSIIAMVDHYEDGEDLPKGIRLVDLDRATAELATILGNLS